ncbi:MAG: DUF1467 family protein [Rhodobacteraceae bacterium]|nr:DUF1467 family protein [Paracoccaceae bacterium]
MSIGFALAIYFMIWWITLFAFLPFGRKRSQKDAGVVVPGSEAGAPEQTYMLRVVVMTTIAATLVFLGYYFLRTSGVSLVDLSIFTPPSMR